jgi:hypothetical protein
MRTLILRQLPWWAIVALVMFVAPAVHADTVFTLTNNGCITASNGAGCGTGPYGTVDLSQQGDSVMVTLTLAPGYELEKSAAGQALEFDITGDPAVTISDLTTGFTSCGADSSSRYGSFDYSISFGSKCTGKDTTDTNTTGPELSFLVTLTGGGTLTPDMFTSTTFDSGMFGTENIFFSSDVISSTTSTDTGDVGALGPGVVTPEPATLGLFALGLVGVAVFRRKLLPNLS